MDRGTVCQPPKKIIVKVDKFLFEFILYRQPKSEDSMARKVFYSFHYQPDCWRVSQVRNIGTVEDSKPVSDNDWEAVTKGGDAKIEKWIADQMNGRSCTVLLIGKDSADRKWINHEIVKTWNDKKGIVGIYIHNLKNSKGEQTTQGNNPFDYITFENGMKLSSIVKAYNPPHTDSKDVYNYISNNLEAWIDEAIKIRNNQ